MPIRHPTPASALALAAALAALAASAPPSLADPAPTYVDAIGAPASDDPAAAKAAHDVLAGYPKAALSAGQDGWVVLNCQPDAHFAPKDCVVRNENPTGAGFGDAALALAAKTPANPAVTPPAGAVQVIEVLFCAAAPAAILPNLLLPLHWPRSPSLQHGPTDAQLDAAWPADARAKGISGRVVMNCSVALDGSLACKPLIEQPQGAGFGAAAAQLAPDYLAAPAQFDGQPRAGGFLQLTVNFGPKPPLPNPPMLASAAIRCKYRS